MTAVWVMWAIDGTSNVVVKVAVDSAETCGFGLFSSLETVDSWVMLVVAVVVAA